MKRLSQSPGDVPLFDIAATRRIEATALTAVPPGTLVRRAGFAVARLALALSPHARRYLVVTGPGNNGADGLEAALSLHSAGHAVQVVTVAGPASPDAVAALDRARHAGLAIDANWPADLAAFDLVIDGLLGIGVSRASEGALAGAIDQLNESGLPVLAIDVPSGLNADTGQSVGRVSVRARATLTMLTAKPGLFTGHGRDHAGNVWCDDLGVDVRDDAAAPAAALLSGLARTLGGAPRRSHALHKGSFGQLVVVGGAPGMSGAAWLAARAGLMAGAGRVYVSLLDEAVSAPPSTSPWPELMQRRSAWMTERALIADAAWVCGCGGGNAVAAALPAVLSCSAALVLDADALNVLARDGALASRLAARGARGRVTVLTPHPLEAARLLGRHVAHVQADRMAAAHSLADRHQAIVVLKGSGSIVASPGNLPFINGTGNAALATAGTGDVLAGWIGGLLAAADPATVVDALPVVVAAVALHGIAADRHGDRQPLPAGRLIEAMADAARQGAALAGGPPHL